MKRQAIILLTVSGLVLGISLTAALGPAWAALDSATLRAVTHSTGPAGTEVDLQLDGAYAYKTVQANADNLFIDLTGVQAVGVARSQEWSDPVFSGYKLLAFTDAAGLPVVRVQMGMRQTRPFVVHQEQAKLRLVFDDGRLANAAAPVTLTKPVPPARTADPAAPLLVSKVSFDKQASGATIVAVATSRSASYHVSTLPNPPRLVIDIEGAANISAQKTFLANTSVLKEIRIGQFRAKDPSIVRVVADLNGDPAFDVQATPTALRIELHPRGPAKAFPIANKPSAEPPQVAAPKHVEDAPKTPAPVAVAKVSPRTTPLAVTAGKTATPPVEATSHDAAKPDVQSTLPDGASAPQVAAAPLPSQASPGPEAIRAVQAAETLLAAKKDDTQAAPPAAPPPSTAGPTEPAKPVYTGEPISLNLKDVDLKDFFRLIHEISGLNIIIDPNVVGNVTLVLDNVPWDQALDIVLRNNDLGKVLEGNVLRIAKLQTLTVEQEGFTKLAAARMDAAPLVTIFRPMNYAKASDIAALLKTWTGGGALTRRGTVLVDVRANTLIITDVESQIPIIQNVLTRIDRKAKQISIEARVVLANADFTRTLASSLLGGWGNRATTTAAGTGATTSQSIPAPTSGAPIPIITSTSATGSGFGVASITNYSARYFINAALTAAEERDQAKTISRPTIVTQNNIQGMVQQGVQVPIQTTINNTISVQYYNATLQLTVTPQVTDDNNIFMVINVLNNSVGASISGIGPEINTQQATTSVLVPDGGTVVFGGITVTSRAKSATYVPLLGNIPVLGHLFKTSNVQDQDQELLFFVSPKILPG